MKGFAQIDSPFLTLLHECEAYVLHSVPHLGRN